MSDFRPHSDEAEQSLLGALMRSPGCLDSAGVDVSPDHFFSAAHQSIYRKILALSADGKACDALSVSDALESAGTLGQVGGMAYLMEIEVAAPPPSAARRHAEIVVERAMLRELLAASAEIEDHATAPGKTVAEKIDYAQQRIMALADTASAGKREPQLVADMLEAHIDRIEQRWSGVTAGLMTGLPDLDRRIPGGMSEGDLIILAGRPGMGKTTLAMNIAEFVAGEGVPVGVCSQEMPTSQLIDRSISSLGRVPLQKLIDGGLTEDEHEKMHSAMMRLKGMPLYIDEQGALRIEDVRRKARQIKARAGIGLLIVDYLQLMVGSGENRNQEISAISGALKALAKELRIPVIALSQLSRKCEERPNKRPVMSDLRECLPVEEWVDTPSGPVQLKTRPDEIITVDGDGAMAAGCSFIEKKYNRTFRVSTPFGSFSATARHQVLTGVGWKAVRDLVPGRDVVACPRRIAHSNKGYLSHGRLLGWLIGNGGLSGTPSLIYRNELSPAVHEAAAMFGVSVRPRRTQKSKNVTESYLSQGVETGSAKNPLMMWIRSLGLENKTAAQKFVPPEYLGSSDETHLDLLRGLWEADGTVTGGSAKYSTCSELLARQVKWLLHTVGVRSTVSFYENGFAGMWEVRCSSEDNARMQFICGDRRRFGELSVPSDRYIDPAPAIFVELAIEIYKGPERLQRRVDGSVKQIPKRRMESLLADCPISTIDESPYMSMKDMGWAPVKSVECDEADVRVCDLHVPGTHCFLTNGLVVHNSGAIEQDADVILFCYRDEVYNPESIHRGLAEIGIGKCRRGEVGGFVPAVFRGDVCRFDSMFGDWPREEREEPQKKARGFSRG